MADRLGLDSAWRLGSNGWQDGRFLKRIDAQVHSERVVIAKPTTYMNDSGRAVVELMDDFELVLSDVLVLVDDVHLDLGRIRIRRGGGDGGHNGLKSIIDSVGSTDFPRTRMGIGSPPEGTDLIDFVLGDFHPQEEPMVEALVESTARAVGCWVREGTDGAMNRVNSNDPEID